jgi:alkylhydroperoxidase family enzyme
MDIGSALGRAAGLTEDKLHALPDYATSAAFDADERLVLELADALAATPADVSAELFARLRARFDEPQLVELASAIAWENYRARYNRVFEIASDNFSEGAFCALPAPAAR